jgi:RHS repeat-associated protein
VSGYTSSSGTVYSGLTSFLSTKDPAAPSGYPKAYLNWILLDDQFNYVSGSSGSVATASTTYPANQMNTVAPGGPVVMGRNGYLYVWVSNETQGWDVFFDNFSVQYKQGPVLEENHYYPFGLFMSGISDKALKLNYAENRYRFGGKELQHQEFSDGSGLEQYDFGKRFQDPQLGTWHGIDPLADSMRRFSPYAYAFDDPIRFTDRDGMVPGPGDLFKTVDDAAKDFAKTYDDNSIANKVEYAATIYKVEGSDGKISYSYSEPNKGTTSHSENSGSGITREDVAHIHTHGDYDPKYANNDFSKTDKDNAKDNGYPNYVSTPNGSLLKYDPQTQATTTVAKDIPSDPKDPTRVNNIDFAPLPKNEPTHNFADWMRDNILLPILVGAQEANKTR